MFIQPSTNLNTQSRLTAGFFLPRYNDGVKTCGSSFNKKIGLVLAVITLICDCTGRSDNPFVMFTVQSNILVLVYFFLAVLPVSKESRGFQILHLAALSAIIMTFLIFGCLLTPLSLASGAYDPFRLRSVLAHFVMPAAMFLDALFFSEPILSLKKKDTWYGLVFPVLYYSTMMVRGCFRTGSAPFGGDARYPYFFMDPSLAGWWFEGGEMNIHFGVFPFFFVLLLLSILVSFLAMHLLKKGSLRSAAVSRRPD
jgi:hypothetical protein